jgi:hypothetical protein
MLETFSLIWLVLLVAAACVVEVAKLWKRFRA